MGPLLTWNPIPSLTSLEPAYQSTNRWGCSGPGDVTRNCRHVSSFLLKSLPLLSAPHPRPGKPQTWMGEPWLWLGLCHRPATRPPLATLTSAPSEAQLPYGTCRRWVGCGGLPLVASLRKPSLSGQAEGTPQTGQSPRPRLLHDLPQAFLESRGGDPSLHRPKLATPALTLFRTTFMPQ